MRKAAPKNRSGDVLGLNEVVSALADRVNTDGGRNAVMSLEPAASREEAEQALDETGAMIELMEARPDFDIEPCSGVPGLLKKARKNHTLTGSELRVFIPLLRAGERTRRIFAEENIIEGHPLWVDMPAIHGLGELIDESIDEDGQVRPGATPGIERLHKSVNSLRRSIRQKAEALLKDKTLAETLQDNYVTLRENRFVLPVKAEHKSRVEGIIHDSSNSGQTFFIEPRALVDLNNRLRTLEIELADEIARLLKELSVMISQEADTIEVIHDAVARLDLIAARSRLAMDLECSRPLFGRGLDLKGAVNPVMALEGKRAVANDMELPEEASALIISGPNTGGKTVALKTIGLISLMARMGLYITAGEGSRVPFYSEIYADIGDSQSITDDLSTFSAHLATINEIVSHAGEGALALLDELMVSTDPKEGSALAAAVLDHLVERGADVVVTTHFQELKTLARFQPNYHNVAMEFDNDKGLPTYRMVGGVSGSSSALVVAEKLGLKREIIAAAKARLEGGDERLEKALEELSAEKFALEKARREAEKTLGAARTARVEAEALRDEMRRLREDMAKTAKRKISSSIAAAKREIYELVERAKSSSDIRVEARRAGERLERMAAEAREAGAPDERIPRDRLKEGDEVYIIPLEKRGVLVSPPSEGKAEVELGAMRAVVSLEDVIGSGSEETGDARAGKGRAPSPEIYRPRKERNGPPAELDIRGSRVEEAIDKLDKYLDTMFNAGIERARVIHGKGTGALRSATRERLSVSPYVKDFFQAEDREGGDGATIVILNV